MVESYKGMKNGKVFLKCAKSEKIIGGLAKDGLASPVVDTREAGLL
jgi:hypothetical protein